MNDKRPVNLDIGTIKLPITSYVSILHRISGVILFFAVAIFLWLFDASLASEEGFAALRESLQSPFWQLIIWGCLAGLVYHLVAGVRHIFMDFGIGESLEGGRLSSKVVLVVALLLIIAAGAWLWL